MLLVILLYAILGFTITLSKLIITGYASPVFLVGARMIFAGIFLSIYTYWKYTERRAFEWYDWLLFAQFALFGILIPHTFRSWSLQYMPPVKAAILFCLGPFFAAILEYILHKTKLNYIQIVGLLIGFIGILPVLTLKAEGTSPQLAQAGLRSIAGLFTHIGLPDIIMLIAVASINYSFFVMQTIVRQRQLPPFVANGISMLLGGFFAFNAALYFEPTWLRGSGHYFVALLILNILLSNVVCANLHGFLLKRYSPTFLAFAHLLTPIFAGLYSWILFGEYISWHAGLSLFLVLFGLSIYCHEEIRKSSFAQTASKHITSKYLTIKNIFSGEQTKKT